MVSRVRHFLYLHMAWREESIYCFVNTLFFLLHRSQIDRGCGPGSNNIGYPKLLIPSLCSHLAEYADRLSAA